MSQKEPEGKFEITTQEWTFSVSVQDISPQETVYITGSTEQLGQWDYNKMVPLEKVKDTDIWRKLIVIPNTCNVYYRYVICSASENPDNVIVRRWETNVDPRFIPENMLHPVLDQFGDYDGHKKVTTGWLTSQTLIQFKFVNNPLKLKSRLADRPMNIKVTPVKLSFGTEVNIDESSISADKTDVEVPAGVQVEVCTLNNDPAVCKLHLQEQFGRLYKPDDILLVNVTASNYKVLAYLVDFYSYSSRAAPEDPPCHVGYTYILPNMFKPSDGTLELPVTCNVKHRPLGSIEIEYVVIHPMENKLCDMKVSYAKHWESSWKGLEVGHRGLGASFKNKEGDTIRENTIASLKKAAASGADLLEFDVQLSKDMIPVIYHDFYVCISMKRKKEIEFSEILELPVKDLTLEHLQKLKVYHIVEGRSHEILFFDDDLEENQPFPTLQAAFESINIHVGFNVELKWTMQMKDGTFELDNPFDMNTYVDKVLEVVLKYAGERRVVFSCFNPDICTMVRYKQNKYPVMFLTIGVTNKYEPYRDPRCLSIPAAVQSALSADLLGIVVHTEDLLRDPTQVKMVTDAGLVIFCWGDDNNDKNTINKLKKMGLHAVIYDKLDKISTKQIKESIFLVEARESYRDVLLAELTKQSTPGSSKSEVDAEASPYLNLAVREKLKAQRSTVTSLESLASSVDYEEIERSLKRNRDVIAHVNKDSQVKERASFLGLFPPPAGCEWLFKPNPKKTRPDDCL